MITLQLLSCKSSDHSSDSSAPRLVVLSPEVAEIIAALGAQDLVVGITRECDYPITYDSVEKVGNFGAVDKEAIIALKPDLIFTSALEQENLSSELAKLGFRVEKIYPQKLDDLPIMVTRIGALIGKDSEAKALSDSLSGGIAAIRSETAASSKPKVYLEIYRDPLMSVSDASFVGEVIETAGGDNIFSSLERDYARVDPEDVVKANPDIIICFSQDTLESIKARKGWQDIAAVRNNRIYFEQDLDPDWIQQATPRTLSGLRKLREICDFAANR